MSQKNLNKVRLNFAWDTFWKCLTNFLLPCKGIWARRQFENVLEKFIRFQLNLGWDKIGKCLRKTSKGCHWILPQTHFGNALQPLWFLVPCKWAWAGTQIEKVLERFFIRFQLNSGWDKIWKCLRLISIVCDWISPQTQYGNALQFFWYHANEYGLGDNWKTS